MGVAPVERRLQGLAEGPCIHWAQPGNQQNVDQILHPAALPRGVRACIGVGLFGYLLWQGISAGGMPAKARSVGVFWISTGSSSASPCPTSM